MTTSAPLSDIQRHYLARMKKNPMAIGPGGMDDKRVLQSLYRRGFIRNHRSELSGSIYPVLTETGDVVATQAVADGCARTLSTWSKKA